jgi:TolA-binding protein
MDKDVLLQTLNRLENKVDVMSTGLATNTAETKAHTGALEEIKKVHHDNGKVITNTREEIGKMANSLLRIESWKNGQTLYQEKTNSDLIEFNKRLTPIEQDYKDRSEKQTNTKKRWGSIFWSGVEKAVLLVAGAILISWKTIIDNLK